MWAALIILGVPTAFILFCFAVVWFDGWLNRCSKGGEHEWGEWSSKVQVTDTRKQSSRVCNKCGKLESMNYLNPGDPNYPYP